MSASAPTEPSVVPTPAAASSRGQKVWAVLLVLDSFFVIIFGGALAAKLYQHWQAPAAAVVPQRAHRPVKAPAPKAESKPAEPAPPPAPPAAPKAAAPKPAAPAAAQSGPRPPKPSLIQDAPLHQSAQPQGAGAASASAPGGNSAAAKNKALPTDFSIKAPGARSVELAGAFIVHGGKKPMVAHDDGVWTITLYLTPNTYRYWFLVNGKHTLDPRNSKTDRNASVVTVGQ